MLYEGYASEFKITTAERTKISDQFRSSKQLIEQLMSDNWKGDADIAQAIRLFKIDTGDYIKAVGEILSSPSIQHNPQLLNRLLSSYLHMFINKMFVSNQRKIELVIFDYLLRYYNSKIAREKQRVSILPSVPVKINSRKLIACPQ
jgi:hypothetical protein